MSRRGARIRIGATRTSVASPHRVRPKRTGGFVAAISGASALVVLAIVGIGFSIKPRLMGHVNWGGAVLVPTVVMTNNEVPPSVPIPSISKTPAMAESRGEKVVPELLVVLPRERTIVRRVLEPTLESLEPWGSFEIDREAGRTIGISRLPETQGDGDISE